MFGVDSMAGLCGSYGVGHVRYPTSGLNTVEEAQVYLTEIRMFDKANRSRQSEKMLVIGWEEEEVKGNLTK